jgi:hypothetical protein
MLTLMSKGASIMETAAAMRISRDTLYRWAKENKEFGEALVQGREWSEAQNASIIKAVGVGHPEFRHANVPALRLYMQNTAGWDKDKPEFVNNRQTININNMNILQDKSDGQLLEYINNCLEDIQQINPSNQLTDFSLYEHVEAPEKKD